MGELNVCGDAAVYINPSKECEDCMQFEERLSEVEEAVEGKQDQLTAGDGITIDDENVISAERNAANTYTKIEVNDLLANLSHPTIAIVPALPAEGVENVLYFTPNGAGYDEYIWANNQWIQVNSLTVDLSDYQEKLVEGANIQITNGNIISATDTTYDKFVKATASTNGADGLVPGPQAGKQGQFLRGDGTWATPANTTYNDATTTVHGLMSAADKTKLNKLTANGARQWTQLGSFTGSGSLTINLADYVEVMVAGRVSVTNEGVTTVDIASSVLPKALLSSSPRDWYIGGGVNGATYVNQLKVDNRSWVVSISTTKVTGKLMNANQTNKLSSTTWYVYAR